MATVARLVTLADLDGVADVRGLSVSVRHEALLEDGRRVLLLDDRGWSSWLHGTTEDEVADVRTLSSVEDIEQRARMVVGPDEPFDGRSHEDMAADHWAWMAGHLRQQGVVVDAQELTRLPHDVVLSERLLARVG
jgi:hypothetical protein